VLHGVFSAFLLYHFFTQSFRIFFFEYFFINFKEKRNIGTVFLWPNREFQSFLKKVRPPIWKKELWFHFSVAMLRSMHVLEPSTLAVVFLNTVEMQSVAVISPEWICVSVTSGIVEPARSRFELALMRKRRQRVRRPDGVRTDGGGDFLRGERPPSRRCWRWRRR